MTAFASCAGIGVFLLTQRRSEPASPPRSQVAQKALATMVQARPLSAHADGFDGRKLFVKSLPVHSDVLPS